MASRHTNRARYAHSSHSRIGWSSIRLVSHVLCLDHLKRFVVWRRIDIESEINRMEHAKQQRKYEGRASPTVWHHQRGREGDDNGKGRTSINWCDANGTVDLSHSHALLPYAHMCPQLCMSCSSTSHSHSRLHSNSTPPLISNDDTGRDQPTSMYGTTPHQQQGTQKIILRTRDTSCTSHSLSFLFLFTCKLLCCLTATLSRLIQSGLGPDFVCSEEAKSALHECCKGHTHTHNRTTM